MLKTAYQSLDPCTIILNTAIALKILILLIALTGHTPFVSEPINQMVTSEAQKAVLNFVKANGEIPNME